MGERCPLGTLAARPGKTSSATRQILTELYATGQAHLLAGAGPITDQGHLAERAWLRISIAAFSLLSTVLC
ncbi:hypothetical protein ACSMXN_20715 [Jatrophihabitans sp. DSM 45814]